MSDVKLLPCPFCNVGVIYETSREDYIGTIIPQLFCDSCKMIFEVENDSPYLNDKKTEEYLKEKLYKQFNTRKSVQDIVDRLEQRTEYFKDCYKYGTETEELEERSYSTMMIYEVASLVEDMIDIVKEVGGLND